MAHIIVQDDISEWRKRVRAELNRLAQMQIRVGVLGSEDGELLRIAYVHEFGATITPRNARNLAIPLSPAARKNPRATMMTHGCWTTEKTDFLCAAKAAMEIRLNFCTCLCRR